MQDCGMWLARSDTRVARTLIRFRPPFDVDFLVSFTYTYGSEENEFERIQSDLVNDM
jgi:hypothetical protein